MVEILTERGVAGTHRHVAPRHPPRAHRHERRRVAHRGPAGALVGRRPAPPGAQPVEGLSRAQSRGPVRRPRDPRSRRVCLRRRHRRGPTAAVLLAGDGGTMSFRPAPEAEREQVRIYAGSDAIETRVRRRVPALQPFGLRRAPVRRQPDRGAAPDPVLFRRADATFREQIAKSFSLDLADLSRDTWSLPPAAGRLSRRDPHAPLPDADLFEVGQRRGGHLGVRSAAAAQHLDLPVGGAPGGRRRPVLDDDERAAFDISHYELDVAFDPDPAVAGRPRPAAPARPRRRHQQPDAAPRREPHGPFDLQQRVRPPAVAPDPRPEQHHRQPQRTTRRAAPRSRWTSRTPAAWSPRSPIARRSRRSSRRIGPQVTEGPSFPSETSLLYSTRTYWYPQGSSGGYATAVMHLTVPETFQVVASGELAPGSPVVVPGLERQPAGRRYTFDAKQPVRYLACLISRLVRVDARTVSLVEALTGLAAAGAGALPAEPLPAGSFNSELDLVVEANPRQLVAGPPGRAGGGRRHVVLHVDHRRLARTPRSPSRSSRRSCPGGHSPAYLAVLYQPLPTTTSSWANDPAAFADVPRVLHRPRDWRTSGGARRSAGARYHDQWISEGFAQYFAALYARKRRGDDALRRHAPADGEVGARRRASRARSRSATAWATSRATAASSAPWSTTSRRSCCTCSAA